jgi:hypothetical protein
MGMKHFRAYITELFEQPWARMYDTVVQSYDGTKVVYVYEDPQNPGERGALVVEFAQIGRDSDTWELLFHRGGEYSNTGTGGASGVFASVLDAARRFLGKHTAPMIRFSAGKRGGSDSKARAYTALVRRFVRDYGYAVKKEKDSATARAWLLQKA